MKVTVTVFVSYPSMVEMNSKEVEEERGGKETVFSKSVLRYKEKLIVSRLEQVTKYS